jgi:hypothetical protein
MQVPLHPPLYLAVHVMYWRAGTQVRYLIRAINEASEAIPGWDEYEKTGRASQLWDGTFPEDTP